MKVENRFVISVHIAPTLYFSVCMFVTQWVSRSAATFLPSGVDHLATHKPCETLSSTLRIAPTITGYYVDKEFSSRPWRYWQQTPLKRLYLPVYTNVQVVISEKNTLLIKSPMRNSNLKRTRSFSFYNIRELIMMLWKLHAYNWTLPELL
jgi:hypothetical protein